MTSKLSVVSLIAALPFAIGCNVLGPGASGIGPDGSGGYTTSSSGTTSSSSGTTSSSSGTTSSSSGTTSSSSGTTSSGGGSGGRTGTAPPSGVNYGTHCKFPITLNAEVDQLYTKWKTAHYVGGRIQRDAGSPNYSDTVSEGIGYGMLMAAYTGDQTMLTTLWNYAKSHMDSRGMMNWKIDASGNTTGQNAATDGDEDMAWALWVAGKRWGGTFATDASSLIGKILTYEVDSGDVMRVGDDPNDVTGYNKFNPSYFAPAYYREWATLNSRWSAILTKSYDMLEQCSNKTTGLTPDWCYSGSPNPATYGEEAFRAPWRIAMDYCWNGEPRALTYLTKLATTMQVIGKYPAAVLDISTAKPSGNVYGNTGSTATAGLAAMASTDSKLVAYAQSCYDAVIAAKDGSYYHGGVALLGVMMMNYRYIKY